MTRKSKEEKVIERLVRQRDRLLQIVRSIDLACANVGIKIDKAFVWSRGDGSQSGGHGERIYLRNMIDDAIADDDQRKLGMAMDAIGR